MAMAEKWASAIRKMGNGYRSVRHAPRLSLGADHLPGKESCVHTWIVYRCGWVAALVVTAFGVALDAVRSGEPQAAGTVAIICPPPSGDGLSGPIVLDSKTGDPGC
jgi:predicted cobalt transporter CbtA